MIVKYYKTTGPLGIEELRVSDKKIAKVFSVITKSSVLDRAEMIGFELLGFKFIEVQPPKEL